ncbi:MAG: DUF2061 domain-containing protein [Gammaproteobacteria bacterium]|jgi:uncharacterized membrane protein
MRKDLAKTLSFAVLHFGVGFSVTYALTGSFAIASGVALIEPLANTVVFFFHEKLWRRLRSRGRAMRIRQRRGAHGSPLAGRTRALPA